MFETYRFKDREEATRVLEACNLGTMWNTFLIFDPKTSRMRAPEDICLSVFPQYRDAGLQVSLAELHGRGMFNMFSPKVNYPGVILDRLSEALPVGVCRGDGTFTFLNGEHEVIAQYHRRMRDEIARLGLQERVEQVA